MSGHSKWHNIRVRKGAQDARKGKAYTKFARLIEIAAREGGGDPGKNTKLRSLIDAAKSESVPNANIERAIKKGTGELKGEAMQELLYEAYGPGGAALLIACLTDNRNRTLSNVKLILSKHGGRLAENGAVRWMFQRKGVVMAHADPALFSGERWEASELRLIDAGAEDIDAHEGVVRVLTDPAAWPRVRDALQAYGATVTEAGVQEIPQQTAPLDAATMDKVQALITALEEDDDVSEVESNATMRVA